MSLVCVFCDSQADGVPAGLPIAVHGDGGAIRLVRDRSEGGSDSALLALLATLGSEGWELVSVFDENSPSDGMTYLFKRQARVMP